MKKRLDVITLILLGLLLTSPLIYAEEQVQTQLQTYSGFNRFGDNVRMFFSFGDNKVNLALEIREKEVNSAIINTKNGNDENAVKNLEKAQDKLKLVQEKTSLKNSEEVKISVSSVLNKITEEENLPEDFKKYALEEEKTYLTAKLTEVTYEYCKELAKKDFALMLKEKECNPDTAIPGLEKELKELKDIQIKSFVQLMLEIRSCIDDPGTCNCEANVDVEQKAKCEKMVALALKCEYKEDEPSCSELKAMEPKKGDNFAESFVPAFLMNLFKEKEYMVGYNINHSDGVPEECWDKNDKPECKQYDDLKETKEDWDEYGNYIGKRPKNKEPTMQESIPQCFDKSNNFLEEKCGKITIFRNEEGLVNYLIEKEIDKVINEFENKSIQNTIDKGEWTVEGEQNQIQNKTWEIKGEMNQINNQIAERTYADGTSAGGEAGVVIVGDKQGIVTDVNANGDNGLTTEIKNYLAGDGTLKNEPLPTPDLNRFNPDLYDPNARAPGDTIDETYDDDTLTSVDAGITTEGDIGTEGTNEVLLED
jgi:hypothetical protein